MASTINDVKSGYWEGDLLVPSQVSDMAIERDILEKKCEIEKFKSNEGELTQGGVRRLQY